MSDELDDEPEAFTIPEASEMETTADGMGNEMETASVEHWSKWIVSHVEIQAKKGLYAWSFPMAKASKSSEALYPLSKVFDAVKAAFDAKGYAFDKETVTIDDGVKPFDQENVNVGWKAVIPVVP